MGDERYVALLRAVNVGGKTLSMEALRALATARGLRDVSTFIQSGNLLFTSDANDRGKLARGIETAIAEEMGLDVTVIVRARAEMRAIADGNPFLGDAPQLVRSARLLSGTAEDLEDATKPSQTPDAKFLHVTFLASPVEAAFGTGEEGERFLATDSAVYLHYPAGYGRTKLNNAYFERLFSVRATTRNWNSTRKLAELLQQYD